MTDAELFALLAEAKERSPLRLVKLWLDDIRPAPEGWIWAKTASDACQILASVPVRAVSLDHDLGPSAAGTGYEVACWIEEAAATGKIGRLRWRVHSANPVGADRMRAALDAADRAWDRR